MYNNFEILEAKCKKYYMKKALKIVLPVGFVLIVALVSIILSSDDKKDNAVVKPVEKKIEEKIEKIVKKKEIKKEEKIIKDVEYDLHLYSYNLLNKKQEVIPKKPLVKAKPIVKTEVKKEPFSLSLKKINSVDEMIKIYNKEKKYSLAVKIADTFYKQKNYKKSLEWSKKANVLNPKKVEAWLLYAKSEYEQGNKVRAQNILRVYIKNSNSKEAKELLIAWIKENN
ncbi:MAG: hypothetical protein U9N02_01255 [Campylobacterota bacterium]|nr:hypothetical protein [Campylobacterota bacterium]